MLHLAKKSLIFPQAISPPTVVGNISMASGGTMSFPVGTEIGDFAVVVHSGLGSSGYPFFGSTTQVDWGQFVLRGGNGSVNDMVVAWKKLTSTSNVTLSFKANGEAVSGVVLRGPQFARVNTFYGNTATTSSWTFPTITPEFGNQGIMLAGVLVGGTDYTTTVSGFTDIETQGNVTDTFVAYAFDGFNASTVGISSSGNRTALVAAALELFDSSVTSISTGASHVSSGDTLAGQQAGDLVIAYSSADSGSASITPGVGWTHLYHPQVADGYNYHVCWKILTNTTYNNHGIPGPVKYACYRGADGHALTGAHVRASFSSSGTSVTHPSSITWSNIGIRRDCKGLVAMITSRDNAITATQPSGWTSRFNTVVSTYWKTALADKLSSLTSESSITWSNMYVNGYSKDGWLIELY